MATTTEYTIETELTDMVNDVLNKPEHSEFKPIRDLEIVIVPCFVVKTDKDGVSQPTSGAPAKLKKVSSLHRLFMKPKPHYILLMDYHAWENSPNDTRRCAMIHHALMQIDVERNEAGSILLGARSPDVVAFAATIRRYDAWTEVLEDVRETFRRSSGKLLPRKAPKPQEEEEPEPETETAGRSR